MLISSQDSELSTRSNGEGFKIGRHLSQVQLLIQERDPTIFGVSQGSLHQFSSQRFHLVINGRVSSSWIEVY